MLLIQHQIQTPVDKAKGKSSNGKKHWARTVIITFWIGLFIAVNVTLAIWINTDSQFSVKNPDATLAEKAMNSINIRARDIKNIFRKDNTREVLPDAPVQIAYNQTSEPNEVVTVTKQTPDDNASFSTQEFWESFKRGAGNIKMPSLRKSAGNKPIEVTNVDGIDQQDRFIQAIPTQVKGVSAVTAGRYTGDGYKEFVAIGDTIGNLYDQIGTPVVGPNGDIAYVAVDGEMMKVILDGKEIASHKDIGPTVYRNGVPLEGQRFLDANIPAGYLRSLDESALQFTPDGELVYTAWEQKKPFVMIGEEKSDQFDVVQNPVMSPDGSHIAYIVGKGISVAGAVTTPPGCDTEECIQMFANMAGYAVGTRAHTYFAVADGVMSLPYDEIANLAYSANGASLSFIGRRGDKWHTVMDGKEGDSYDEIRGLQVSPDGKDHVYAARKGNVWALIKNGKVIANLAQGMGKDFLYNFDDGTFAFTDSKQRFFAGNAQNQIQEIPGYFLNASPTEGQVALLRQVGSEAQVVLRDVSSGMEQVHDPSATVIRSLISKNGESNLVFSEDGTYSAYPLKVDAAGNIMEQMIVNGIPQSLYKNISNPVFSPDGMRVAYAATAIDPLTGLERALAVVNGQESTLFDQIVSEMQFSSDGLSVSYLAMQNGELKRIVQAVGDQVASTNVSMPSSAPPPPSPFPGLFCPPESVFKDLDKALQTPEYVCGISIPDGNRENLPDAIGTLIYLKHLNLSFNQISRIPESIGNLYDLRWLSLVGNSVEELPKSFENFSQLEYLDVSSNNLRSIPEEIGNLQSLRILNISGNNLRTLPNSLENLSGLERLYANGNNLSEMKLKALQNQLPNATIYGL